VDVPGVIVRWTLPQGEDFAAGHYSRAHALSFDGGAVVMGSSSPQLVPRWSDPAAVDPEELLIASLASCHMLWFLDMARRDGWIVSSYVDWLTCTTQGGILYWDAAAAPACTSTATAP
jgi:organic hydroperoxide reductase OsmC/OhrA